MAKNPPNGTIDLSRQISLVGGPNNAPMVGRRAKTLAAAAYSDSLILESLQRTPPKADSHVVALRIQIPLFTQGFTWKLSVSDGGLQIGGRLQNDDWSSSARANGIELAINIAVRIRTIQV